MTMSKTERLCAATNNQGKLREIREVLEPLGIEVVSQSEIGCSIEPVEDGSTFSENALIKAREIYAAVGMPVIADDSGLCVEALGGRPGVYSARTYPKGGECSGLLADMKDVPADKRGAYFECCIVFIDESGYRELSGRCEGSIGYEQRGSNGFGYDPVFMVGERSLAEMSADEKNAISHRGKALRRLYDFLVEREGE